MIRPQVDRWMAADLRFADGRTARMVCALLSTTIFRAQAVVLGSKGELRCTSPFVPHLFHRLTVRTATGVRREHIESESTYSAQLRAFARAVRDGNPLPTDAKDATANMRVIDAIYERAGLRRRGG
jgi:predicted dehydrogenase